jgi:hypothetical protein
VVEASLGAMPVGSKISALEPRGTFSVRAHGSCPVLKNVNAPRASLIELRRSEGDVLLIKRTNHFAKQLMYRENDGHENKQMQRRADYWFSAAVRSQHANQGHRAQTRLQTASNGFNNPSFYKWRSKRFGM